MKEMIISDIKPLTLTEMRVRIADDNRNDPNGHYLPGVGIIGLQNAKNTVFLVVGVRDMPVQSCDKCAEPMALMKTKAKTTFKTKNALYYKCRNSDRRSNPCDNNAYPKYARNDFDADRTAAIANGDEEAVLCDIDGLLLPSATMGVSMT